MKNPGIRSLTSGENNLARAECRTEAQRALIVGRSLLGGIIIALACNSARIELVKNIHRGEADYAATRAV